MNRLLVWFAASVLLLAAALSCTEKAPVKFPHQVHLADQHCGGNSGPPCLSCASCHRSSADGPALSLPRMEVCGSCHQNDAAKLSAPTQNRESTFSRSVRFSHPQHLAMPEVRGQCVPCHAGVALGEEKAPPFPPMQKCFSCHEHQAEWQRSECTPCHARKDIEHVMPETFLRHDGDFSRRHGGLARSQIETCRQCHSESQCNDCHNVTEGLEVERRNPEAIQRNFVHTGNFEVRHALEAKTDSAKCLRCHTTDSCEGCHLERGVSANRLDAANPHPAAWVGSFPGDPNFHGRAARRDIAACAACHDQGPATNCIPCHRVGAYGGNPHPSGWRSARSENATMCRYCHEGSR